MLITAWRQLITGSCCAGEEGFSNIRWPISRLTKLTHTCKHFKIFLKRINTFRNTSRYFRNKTHYHRNATIYRLNTSRTLWNTTQYSLRNTTRYLRKKHNSSKTKHNICFTQRTKFSKLGNLIRLYKARIHHYSSVDTLCGILLSSYVAICSEN